MSKLSLLSRSCKNSHGFTLVELMIVIAITGILAAALFPALSQYIARAHDTTRYEGARTIKMALSTYNIDNGSYPNFPGQENGGGFTHECSNFSDGGYTWMATIEPIIMQYMQKSPRDRIGKWPFCYMYKKGFYNNCSASILSGYLVIFATEKSHSNFTEAYSIQGEGGSAARYCITP